MHTNPQMVELHNPCPGDLFWWRGLSERNIFNQMPVCMLAHVHIKKWACPLRGSSRTCDCAKEGEVQSMHGDFVQQYIQNNKPCVKALFMQLNMAMLFPCLKASCLCHSAAHGHLLQIYWSGFLLIQRDLQFNLVYGTCEILLLQSGCVQLCNVGCSEVVYDNGSPL